MSEPTAEPLDAEPPPPATARPSRFRLALLVLGVVVALGLGITWLARERIAHSIIAGTIEDLGLPATYELESVGPQRQVLKNIVIGDLHRPDLTVARAVVDIEPRFGVPVIGRVRVEGARIYGSYRAGQFSFGTLDKVIFAKRDGPSGLPDLDLTLVDGRARFDTDYGIVGARADGSGNLRGGFEGKLAAIAPQIAIAGCKGSGVTLTGEIMTARAQAQFSGPMRMKTLSCPMQQLSARELAVKIDAELGELFDSAKGNYALQSGAIRLQGSSVRTLDAQGTFALAKGDLVADYDLSARQTDLGFASAAEIAMEGTLRSRDDFAGFDGEGRLEARSLRSGRDLTGGLVRMEKSGEGTLLAPLARQLRTAFASQERGSSLTGDYSLRQMGGLTQITIPFANLKGGNGSRLIGLSRFAMTLGMKGGPRFTGNFVTGGPGLPQMEGVAQRQGRGGMEARLRMAEYRAGTSAIALPELRLVQLPGGEIGFAGQAQVSGQLPGGEVRGLRLPIDGNWSQRGGLAVWRRCTAISFDRFKVGNLALQQRGMTLCPGRDGAILRSDGRGMRLAAGTAGLSLDGTLGTTPVRLKSKSLGFAYPGAIAARGIDVSMGPLAKPSTLRVASFDGKLGPVVTGRFTGTELKLFAVPLDMSEGAGQLRFANGMLDLSEVALKVTDREQPARFFPLIARDAVLKLRSTTFTADAMLREPASDREIVRANIVHDLDTARGFADLTVPGIRFDDKLQPTTLTYFAEGVIALAKGTVTGTGRIDWDDAGGVTSTGEFTTDGLDFAAGFGPVKGTRGTVRFTDLLGLVTVPDQRLQIAAINPGIEVFDGTLSFQLEPQRLMVVNGADWPFLDGQLKLLPTRMVLGNAETRRFTLKVDGANAAKFVSQLELANISASGIFDGTLPLIFDEEGGRIENGLLVSRPPGGNLSYVGELTYKDLSAMGNFAFQTLRSLDFQRMEIGMNGKIDGDIITTLRMSGVRQGPGTKRNLITRQFAGLPIQFNINIKAPFYQLVTSFKSLYDDAYVRDPRTLGLIDEQGNPIDRPDRQVPPPPNPGLPPPGQPAPSKNDDIQDPDSRNSP